MFYRSTWISILLPVCSRRHLYRPLEHLPKMGEVAKSCTHGDIRNGIIAFAQQALRLLNPKQIQIIAEGKARRLLKQPAEIVRADSERLRYPGQRKTFLIVVVQITDHRLGLGMKNGLGIGGTHRAQLLITVRVQQQFNRSVPQQQAASGLGMNHLVHHFADHSRHGFACR